MVDKKKKGSSEQAPAVDSSETVAQGSDQVPEAVKWLEDHYVTLKEAAEMLGKSEMGLRNLLMKKADSTSLQGAQLFSRWIVSRESIKNYLSQRADGSTHETELKSEIETLQAQIAELNAMLAKKAE
jgi:hypothetical protein